MNKDDMQAMLEAMAKGGITVNGDLVLEKNVDYEVDNVEAGGIGIHVINGVMEKVPEGGDEVPQELPLELSTATAMNYWKKLRDSGWVDEHWQRTEKMTLSMAAYTVHCFARVLHLNGGWAMFEHFWGCQNLRQEYARIQNKPPTECERLKILFDL